MFPIQKIAIQVEKRIIYKSTVNLYLQQTEQKGGLTLYEIHKKSEKHCHGSHILFSVQCNFGSNQTSK